MKDYDTFACATATNRCDLHQPTGDRLGDRMPVHFKLVDIRMENSKECQSDPALILNSRHGLQLGASLFDRAKRADSNARIDPG
jgi:hypothetical protein